MKLTCSCGQSYWPNQAWIHRSHGVANAASEDVANSMANTSDMANSASNNVANKTYQYRDAEMRREYQREYMRKKRAKAAAPV